MVKMNSGGSGRLAGRPEETLLEIPPTRHRPLLVLVLSSLFGFKEDNCVLNVNVSVLYSRPVAAESRTSASVPAGL